VIDNGNFVHVVVVVVVAVLLEVEQDRFGWPSGG
jgi:hypothetical protein